MMLAVQYIIGQLNSPVEQLMNFFYSLQDVKISLERINEIHQMDDENGKEGLLTSIEDKNEGIDIKNIMFKYDPHALRKTIDDVSIHIPQGKVTIIVGASGSGKTTLIRLMLGYYPVLEGKINIGNTDINKLNKKWWRRQCGVVMQDGVIFSESIARNIAVDVIPQDSMFEKAIRQQQIVSLYAPETKSAKAFEILANNLIEGAHDIPLMKRGFAQLFAEFFNNR